MFACQARDQAVATLETVPVESAVEGGAVSTAPVQVKTDEPAKPDSPPAKEQAPPPLDWSPQALAPGVASVGCDLDYKEAGDGEPLLQLDREHLVEILSPCAEKGVLRVRYAGKINAEFGMLMARISQVAEDLGIGKRVLDIDSSGGFVEEAIKAGDQIAESGWTEWVREGSSCHSACVFILAAADNRVISGRVGIHRIIRMSSTATTRTELNHELRTVYGNLRDYLERNGAATGIADLMMAVPNRSLRLLDADELRLYGLDGPNPAQDDLDRLRLMRKCGEDFVSRRDAFVRAFDLRCKQQQSAVEAISACGLELRAEFGFPDSQCPAESPMSEYDATAQQMIEAPPAAAGTR